MDPRRGAVMPGDGGSSSSRSRSSLVASWRPPDTVRIAVVLLESHFGFVWIYREKKETRRIRGLGWLKY